MLPQGYGSGRHKAPSFGSCAPQPASRGSGAIKANAPRPTTYWLQPADPEAERASPVGVLAEGAVRSEPFSLIPWCSISLYLSVWQL
jgi:hypothetical protein